MQRLTIILLYLFSVLLFLLSSCSSIDCPVETRVAVQYEVPDTLKDTLWVFTRRADGKDTLLNRLVNTTHFSLPISYQNPEDTLFFVVADTSHVMTLDTVFVTKEDIPHFESVDCAAHFFHRLSSVRCTGIGIDSIIINTPLVDYDQKATHLRIYFKNRH